MIFLKNVPKFTGKHLPWIPFVLFVNDFMTPENLPEKFANADRLLLRYLKYLLNLRFPQQCFK